MNCKCCGSNDVARSRRRGIWDRVQSTLGLWPYRCEQCGFRFVAPHRFSTGSLPKAEANDCAAPHDQSGSAFRAYAASAEQGPEIAFQTHSEKPHAKIVLQADTHEQLNQILLTLNRAVNSYQTASTSGEPSPTDGKSAGKTR